MASGLKEAFDYGAESIIYTGYFLGDVVIVKRRVSKPYRNDFFDKLFRSVRTRIEAKVMLDLLLNNVKVPKVISVDLENYVIVMEYIDGVKMINVASSMSDRELQLYSYKLGLQVGRMHSIGIYHGDLTLANIMLTRGGEVYLIDFGLAGYSKDVEEYAIDLHLLKRSFQAVSPGKLGLFIDSFMKGYGESYSGDLNVLLNRLSEVELRGRYVEARLRKKLGRERYAE